MGLGNYIKETRGELRHVSWPSRNQAIAYTLIVIGISVALALILGLFDQLFTVGLKYLVTSFGF